MFATFGSVLMLVVFLVPGFVWRTVEAQFIYLDKRLQWEKFALGLLARSTVIYMMFATGIYQVWQEKWYEIHPIRLTIGGICLFGILPSLCGFISGVIRQRDCIPRLIRAMGLRTFEQHQIPTAWDYIFSRITPRWAIITFRDGSKLYGFVGEESYFSSDPEARDLFISHVIQRTGDGKMELIPNTAGVYVGKEQVAFIEFLTSGDGDGKEHSGRISSASGK